MMSSPGSAQKRLNVISQQAVPGEVAGHKRELTIDEDIKTSSGKDKEFFKEEFEKAFYTIADECISTLSRDYEMPERAVKHIKRLMHWTVPGGKNTRGLTVVSTVRALIPESDYSTTDMIKSQVLGWCVELLQAFFLIADDIMDQSVWRRQLPCWYKAPLHPSVDVDTAINEVNNDDIKKVGLIACNDYLIVESFIYKLLKLYFRDDPAYVDLIDLFHETSLQTELGQLLDLLSEDDYENFTMEHYKKIVKYKTAFYSFWLPCALALAQCGITDQKLWKISKEILLYMGEYFQIQDDYLDCYVFSSGTDISDGKCTWLVCQAKLIADDSQLAVLQENYGQGGGDNQNPSPQVKKVKELYKDLGIQEAYKSYEKTAQKEITAMIENVENARVRKVFTALLARFSNPTTSQAAKAPPGYGSDGRKLYQ